MRAMLRWPVFWWKHKYRYDKDAFAGCYEKSLIEQIRCFVPNVPPTWQEQVVETATSPRVQFVAATVGTAGIAALVLTGPVLAWRRRRRAAMGEQGFYYQDGHGQHGQGMTINVRAPVTVSEWMRRVYWTLALLMLLIPAGFILARTGTLVSLAAALVPVEWQDEVIKGLEALQELVRKASPQ